jgi:multidrug efflux pump subunit AcrA (membrane-fusion protein)
VAILFMSFFPADFQLICKGSLEPIERREVFAGVDGLVDEVYVKHDDMVHAGQLLVRLHNTELGMKLADVAGQLATATERIRSLERALLEENHKLTVEERNRLSGELAEAKEKAKSAGRQKELITEKLKELEIRSPMNGKVLTWDLYQRLRDRPLTRGQNLMRIADLSKDWQLELRMPEDRIGHVVNAQRNLGYGDALPVSYILATAPGTAHKGTIKEVQRIAEVKGDEGSTVLIKVQIRKEDLPEGIMSGTQISAKVYCGRRSIGYVWFHDLVAFIQSRVLFRL